LPTQAGDAPLPPTFGQVDVARTELGAAGAQEGAELVLLLIADAHRRRPLSPRYGDAGWERSLLGSVFPGRTLSSAVGVRPAPCPRHADHSAHADRVRAVDASGGDSARRARRGRLPRR